MQHYKSLSAIEEIIRSGQYADLCRQVHEAVNLGTSDQDLLKKLPLVRFGLGAKGAYTGCVLLSFRTTAQDELERLRHRVNLLPSTLFSFAGSSGLTLKVVLPFTRPDGTLPEGRKLTGEELMYPQSFTDAAVLFHGICFTNRFFRTI